MRYPLADACMEQSNPTDLPPMIPVEERPRRLKRILFVTSEFSDFVKAGGLGDVSAALPRALLAEHDIRVLLPGYRQVLESAVACTVVGHLPGMAALPPCDIGQLTLADGLVVYAVLCPELYDRHGSPYGDDAGQEWPDNHIRFARLSLAAADIAAGRCELNWCPDLLHVNDWPAALAPAYMAWRGQATPSVLTIHNLGYQGSCPLGCRAELGLPSTAGLPESMEFYGKLSFLKAGLNHASHITTVSETYAREITGEPFGCGMHGVLSQRRNRGQLSGITHGIDESWAPSEDPHLVERFDATHLGGKRCNAAYVERQFGLLPGHGPLFAVVSRLVRQKGIDLTLGIAAPMIAAGARLVVIGRGEPELEQAMKRLAATYPGRVGVHIGFDETEARRIFAASDFLLMPSRYEPCGLSQMYAQRFGSLPIARHTGGLADTIVDGVTGLLFRDETVECYFDAVRRALNIYRHPDLLDAMRRKAMDSPQHWGAAVRPYTRLYRRLLKAPLRALR